MPPGLPRPPRRLSWRELSPLIHFVAEGVPLDTFRGGRSLPWCVLRRGASPSASSAAHPALGCRGTLQGRRFQARIRRPCPHSRRNPSPSAPFMARRHENAQGEGVSSPLVRLVAEGVPLDTFREGRSLPWCFPRRGASPPASSAAGPTLGCRGASQGRRFQARIRHPRLRLWRNPSPSVLPAAPRTLISPGSPHTDP